jgi:DNA-binding NarL/FixJ family response regulator
MRVVLLSGDLATISRVEAATTKAGGVFAAAANATQATATCKQCSPSLFIIDLTATGPDINALVQTVTAESAATARVVAFGPHVHESRLLAARQAGCDEVFSRGQFFAQLDTILSRWAAR